MRRTSVGNASVKDIPMLDMFLQRLDRSTTGSVVSAGKPRHSNQSYNNKSDSKTVASKSSSSNPNSVSKATCKQATVTASPSP